MKNIKFYIGLFLLLIQVSVLAEVQVLTNMEDNVFPDSLNLIRSDGSMQTLTVHPVSSWTEYDSYFAVLTDIVGENGESRELVRMSNYGGKNIAVCFHRQFPNGMNDLQLTALWKIVDNHIEQVSFKNVRCSHKLSRRGHWHSVGMEQQGYECTLEDRDFFTYRFSNYHDSLDVGLQREAIRNAMGEFTAVTGQKFIEVVATEKVDLMFSFSGIDGLGNTLAETHIPMCGSNGTYSIIFDNKDNWVLSGANLDKSVNDVESVALHEIGHFLGLPHVNDVESTMFSQYIGGERRGLTYRDKQRLQQPYVLEKKAKSLAFFTKAGSRQAITRNFVSGEFASKCKDVGYEQKVDVRLAKVLQIIRNHYNVPVYINSTHRSRQCNAFVGGAKESQHLFLPIAVADFSFRNADYLNDFKHQIITEGALFQSLLRAGVRGFGAYDTHYHIDFRDVYTDGNSDFKGTEYVFWDYSGDSNSKKSIVRREC